MTRIEMQGLFLQWMNDPNGTFFSPTNFVQPALDRALLELQKQLVMSGDLYYVRSPPSTALTVLHQQDYVLPDDCLKLHRVTIDTDTASPQPADRTLNPISLNQIDRFGNDTGTPQAWVITRNKISLYPIPDSAGKIIRLWYSYQVSEMTSDSSTPDAPEIFHEYIVVLACLDAKIKDETIENNVKEKQLRYQELMKQMADTRNYQTSRQVICHDDGGYWTGF
jgi:hypothetical protein